MRHRLTFSLANVTGGIALLMFAELTARYVADRRLLASRLGSSRSQ